MRSVWISQLVLCAFSSAQQISLQTSYSTQLILNTISDVSTSTHTAPAPVTQAPQTVLVTATEVSTVPTYITASVISTDAQTLTDFSSLYQTVTQSASITETANFTETEISTIATHVTEFISLTEYTSLVATASASVTETEVSTVPTYLSITKSITDTLAIILTDAQTLTEFTSLYQTATPEPATVSANITETETEYVSPTVSQSFTYFQTETTTENLTATVTQPPVVETIVGQISIIIVESEGLPEVPVSQTITQSFWETAVQTIIPTSIEVYPTATVLTSLYLATQTAAGTELDPQSSTTTSSVRGSATIASTTTTSSATVTPMPISGCNETFTVAATSKHYFIYAGKSLRHCAIANIESSAEAGQVSAKICAPVFVRSWETNDYNGTCLALQPGGAGAIVVPLGGCDAKISVLYAH